MTTSPKAPRRKRSHAVGLTAMGAMTMLSACDSGPSDEELSRQMFGAPTEVAMFNSAAECTATGEYKPDQCKEAEQLAWNDSKSAAPRFESQSDCENQFGRCQSGSSGGGGYFMPMMTGFMIANALNSGGPRYAPLYRDQRDNRHYTGSGAWLSPAGGSSNRYKVGERGFGKATTAPKIQTRSAVRSRGGFGTRASTSRSGGWGG